MESDLKPSSNLNGPILTLNFFNTKSEADPALWPRLIFMTLDRIFHR